MYGGFVLSVLTMMLSNFVAVEMTSHQNFLLSCWFNPACIIIALALPSKLVFSFQQLSFAGVCQVQLTQKFHPGLVYHILFGDFCFLHYCPANSFNLNAIFADQCLDPHWYHNNLVTFSFQEKLWLQPLNSSPAIRQCLFPPILSC